LAEADKRTHAAELAACLRHLACPPSLADASYPGTTLATYQNHVIPAQAGTQCDVQQKRSRAVATLSAQDEPPTTPPYPGLHPWVILLRTSGADVLTCGPIATNKHSRQSATAPCSQPVWVPACAGTTAHFVEIGCSQSRSCMNGPDASAAGGPLWRDERSYSRQLSSARTRVSGMLACSQAAP